MQGLGQPKGIKEANFGLIVITGSNDMGKNAGENFIKQPCNFETPNTAIAAVPVIYTSPSVYVKAC